MTLMPVLHTSQYHPPLVTLDRYTHTCIHTYVRTYIHTYIHTYGYVTVKHSSLGCILGRAWDCGKACGGLVVR